MTDDFDALKAALRAAPVPDAAAKAGALALAMKNFDDLQKSGQGSAGALRPIPDRPNAAGIWNRIGIMLKVLTTRQALAGTASIAAICVAVVLMDRAPDLMQDGRTADAPVMPEIVRQTPPLSGISTDQPEALAPDTGGGTTIVSGPVAELAPQPQPVPDPAPISPPAVQESVEAFQAMPNSVPQGALADMAQSTVSKDAELRTREAFASAPMPESTFDPAPYVEPNTEAFANEGPNPVKMTAEEPVSTFSIDVDTASYAVVRNSLNSGMLPPPEAVRIEEMVNYFPYTHPAPTAEDEPFRPTVTVMPTPWNPGTRLVHIAVQGAMPATDNRPPLNLVFLIDTSGSMDEPSKLPLLKQSLSLMLGQLRPQDQVAIVAYAGSAGVVLEPTGAQDVARISAALDNLAAGGSTAGAEGLELAYQVAATMGADGEVSRVLLATDGDFNVGVSDPDGLEAYVAKKRDKGVYLSVLGFGRGNLDDAVMQSLAQSGNGTAAYIDTLNEARKVLVDQVTGALFPIADDVKIQIEWNPATVAEYRLIGYETRALRREDFSNDQIDAGEIGAGVSVTAIYEVTAPGSDALRNDPLRYGAAGATQAADADAGAGELGFLRLRHKDPGAEVSILTETPIGQDSGPASDDARFAVAIAGFGQLLTGATYLGDWGWDQAIAEALAARGEDPYGYRVEAVNLMRMAQSLSSR